jgi:hypothetical protein
MTKEEANQQILKIMNYEFSLSEKENKLFEELIFQCDLTVQNNMGHNPLMYALYYHQKQNLHFNKEQWNYLIENSDLTQQAKNGRTLLFYALYYHQKQNLHFNKEQWNYLIENSDLTQQAKNGRTLLFYAFYYHQKQNLQLTKNQFQTMYNALSKEQQQNIFQNLIKINHNNNHQYVEEINRLLYDLQFQPNEETIYWLQENQHQDILPIIKKRDLFFQLNNNIKSVENNGKIATIKI